MNRSRSRISPEIGYEAQGHWNNKFYVWSEWYKNTRVYTFSSYITQKHLIFYIVYNTMICNELLGNLNLFGNNKSIFEYSRPHPYAGGLLYIEQMNWIRIQNRNGE